MATYQVPSTDLTIQIAKASQVYADRDISRKSLNPNTINPYLAMQLHVASAVLEWTRDYTPSSSYLKSIKNYTLALAGQYIVEALSHIGSGGIIITPTNSTPLGFTGYRNDFTIGEEGSPMSAGDQVLTINLTGFIRNTVMIFPSGINLTIGDDPTSFEVSSIVYTATSVTITLDQAVQDGERYIVTGLRYGSVVNPPSGGGTGTELPIQEGHEGQYLATDGAGNLYWADTHIEYTSANFEIDGITVYDTRLLHNTFDLYWNEGNRYLIDEGDDPEFTRIEEGGFVINMVGWDASSNEYRLYAELKGVDS